MLPIPFEDRFALQDLMTAYCCAVDDLKSGNAPLLDLFTEDAVLDLSDIGLPLMNGIADYKPFFDGVFADMSHHQHYTTNFRIGAYDEYTASIYSHVHGLGLAKGGVEVDVHVRYRMDCVKRDNRWKIKTYWIFAAMPPPASLSLLHAQ